MDAFDKVVENLEHLACSVCRRPSSLAEVRVHGNVLPCCIAPWISSDYDGLILRSRVAAAG